MATDDRSGRPGFTYEVSDEQLARFASATPLQRLQWLEDMRIFTWNAASEETRAEWRRLRQHPPRYPTLGNDEPAG
jgi:hypothetical protein